MALKNISDFVKNVRSTVALGSLVILPTICDSCMDSNVKGIMSETEYQYVISEVYQGIPEIQYMP